MAYGVSRNKTRLPEWTLSSQVLLGIFGYFHGNYANITGKRGPATIIILCLYVVALWLVFSKFKIVRWGWLTGTVAVLIGVFILATFLALFNYLTPSGRVTVTGRVVEVTPNVTGQIVAIPVKPNVSVKMGDVLFQIDPAPFQYNGPTADFV